MNRRVEMAVDLFHEGNSCAQSVALAYQSLFGLDEQFIKDITCGFAGGLRCGEVCGAAVGATIIIGLWTGRSSDAADKKQLCYNFTRSFMDKFEEKQGSVLCRDILGYDIRDLEARKNFPGKQGRVCPRVIAAAVDIIEELCDFSETDPAEGCN